LKGTPPFSGRPSGIVDGIQRIALAGRAGHRPSLEQLYIPLLDSLPTEKYPVRSHQNPVLREERSQGAGVVLVECLIFLRSKDTELIKRLDIPKEITLLSYCCINRGFLLGASWQSKGSCQPD